MFFMPQNSDENEYCLKTVIKHLEKFGLEILHIRNVPVDTKVLGHSIKGNEPHIVQIFIKQRVNTKTINEFESKLFLARRYMEIELKSFDFYVSSLSPRVVTYKGMIMSNSLKDFYLDLSDEMYISSLAIVISPVTSVNIVGSIKNPFSLISFPPHTNVAPSEIPCLIYFMTLIL